MLIDNNMYKYWSGFDVLKLKLSESTYDVIYDFRESDLHNFKKKYPDYPYWKEVTELQRKWKEKYNNVKA